MPNNPTTTTIHIPSWSAAVGHRFFYAGNVWEITYKHRAHNPDTGMRTLVLKAATRDVTEDESRAFIDSVFEHEDGTDSGIEVHIGDRVFVALTPLIDGEEMVLATSYVTSKGW